MPTTELFVFVDALDAMWSPLSGVFSDLTLSDEELSSRIRFLGPVSEKDKKNV